MLHFKFDKFEKQFDDALIKAFIKLARTFDQQYIKEFVRLFQEQNTKYTKKQQHDSPEFVSDFLNIIGKQTSRTKYEFHEPNMYEKRSSEVSWAKLLKNESSIITDLFYEQLKETFSCGCETLIKYEEFLLLDVPILRNSKNYKLFRTNRNEHETCEYFTIHFEEYHELECKYIQSQVKINCKLT